MSPNSQVDQTGWLAIQQQAVLRASPRQRRSGEAETVYCAACENQIAWHQEYTVEWCGVCSQWVHGHCMVDAYEGRVRICRRCIPYIDRLTESERGQAIDRLQRALTERSRMVTHRAMQIGQVVGGGIGGLASAGINLGVGVGSGLYSSARELGAPMMWSSPPSLPRNASSAPTRGLKFCSCKRTRSRPPS